MASETPIREHATKDPYAELRGKAFDAISSYAEMNHRVLGEMVNLSSAAMKETVRVYAELEAAALDAVRSAPVFGTAGPSLEDLAKDPLGGYRKTVLAAGAAPQRLAELFESHGRIIGQGVQRLQASAERSGKEIRDAVTSCVSSIGRISAGG